MYVICVTLLTFSNEISSETREDVGYALIGTFLLTLLFNALIIAFVTAKIIKLIILRLRSRKERTKAWALKVWAAVERIPIICRWTVFGWGEESDDSDDDQDKSDVYDTKSQESDRGIHHPVNHVFIDLVIDEEDPNGKILLK